MKLTLGKQALLVVAIPLLVEVAFVTTIAWMVNEIALERGRQLHARALSYEVNCLIRAFLKRGMIVLLGKLPSGADLSAVEADFKQERVNISKRLDKIERLVEGRPEEQELFKRIVSKKDEFNSSMRRTTQLANQNEPKAAVRSYSDAQAVLEEVMALTDRMIGLQEEKQRREQEAQELMRRAIEVTLGALVVVSLISALGLMHFFRRSALDRLKVLTESTALLADGKPLGQPLSGNDEMADLDSSFRQMAQELESIQQKERALIDNAADVICTLDNSGRFVYINSAVERIWGYKAEELTGCLLSSFVLDDDSGRTLSALKSGALKPDAVIAIKIKQKAGTVAHMQWSARFDESKTGALYCVAHDVTVKVQVEQLKSDFLSMISHDLRTPLTSIQLAHELFIDGAYGELNDEGVEELESADADVDRLMELINQVLDIEKADASALEICCQQCEIDSAIDAAVNSSMPLSRKLGVKIKVYPHRSVRIPIDESRITQVIATLLSNALQSSERGQAVSIKVSSDNHFLKVSVSDSGSPVSCDFESDVFDRFAGKQPMPGRCGTGLGLALCAAIVRLHGGQIGYSSAEGYGCLFWFTLPLG